MPAGFQFLDSKGEPITLGNIRAACEKFVTAMEDSDSARATYYAMELTAIANDGRTWLEVLNYLNETSDYGDVKNMAILLSFLAVKVDLHSFKSWRE